MSACVSTPISYHSLLLSSIPPLTLSAVDVTKCSLCAEDAASRPTFILSFIYLNFLYIYIISLINFSTSCRVFGIKPCALSALTPLPRLCQVLSRREAGRRSRDRSTVLGEGEKKEKAYDGRKERRGGRRSKQSTGLERRD